MFVSLLFELSESLEVFKMLGKPIVEIEPNVDAKLLNCLSLAKLTRSQVDDKGPDCINEAFIGLMRSNLSHSATADRYKLHPLINWYIMMR